MKLKPTLLFFFFLQIFPFFGNAQQTAVDDITAGVHKITFGTPDRFTPYSFCAEKPMFNALSAMPADSVPFNIGSIKIKVTERGCIVEIPLGDGEQLYGFGLQQGSFNQRGLRKKPIV